jgi:hypothetical protein
MFFTIGDALGPVGFDTVDWAWSVQTKEGWSSVPHQVTVPPVYEVEYPVACVLGSTVLSVRQHEFDGFARTDTALLMPASASVVAS